jgi:hypothetical protein
MFKLLPKKRSTRLIVLIWTAVALVALAIVGYHYVAKPSYKNWREKRANSIARQHLKAGDYPAALVAVRKAIQYNPSNVDAWKLAVEITEKQDSPQSFAFLQGLASVQPTLENRLRFIHTAIKYHGYAQAMDVINKVGAEAADSAEFYEVAAQVSQVMRNQTKAKYYLMSLVKLRPNDNEARLELARIRLVDGFEDNKPSIRAEIRGLSNDPALRVRALTLLLADAVQTKNETDSLELAGLLAATPEVPIGTQLMIAEAYRQASQKRFEPYLEQLKKAYADKPDHVAVLISYLATHEMSADVRSWFDTLPAKTREEEGVQMSYAAVLLTLKDYAALDDYLRPLKWTENEYARQAFLAFSARRRGDERAFNQAWRLAVIEVGNDPRRLQSLLSRVTNWGWAEQRIELLWKKFSLDPTDKAARQQIAAWEHARKNTAALNRLSGRVNENAPGDLDSKNDYTYTSLLLNTALDRAHTAALENYQADPKNPYYATTYALSLYKLNKAPQALQVMEKLPIGALASPERTLLHGIFLIANGRIDDGLSQIAHLKMDQFLPEEKQLYDQVSLLVEKARRDQAATVRIASLSNAASAGVLDRKSWLNALPAAYRSSNVQLQLADSLYAADDYTGLEATLKNEKWEENDFLRLALLAYAKKNLGKEVEALSLWRIATTAAGNRSDNLTVLEELCERWGWSAERIDILNRILQRDPMASTAMNDLVDHYQKNGQTAELARIYSLRADAEGATADDKANASYYGILTGTNLTKARVLAKQLFDSAPTNAFYAKTYAFSIYKTRPTEAARTLEKIIAVGETGPAQLSLLRAAIALEQGQTDDATNFLKNFDASSALPEEVALADSITKAIAAKNP